MPPFTAGRIADWLDAALGFVYPDLCQICRGQRAGRKESYVCPDCRNAVRPIRRPFCDRCGLPFEGDITTNFECANCQEMELHFACARSAVAARGPVLEAIHRYKYEGRMWFEPFLAELLIEPARQWLAEEDWEALIPVPLFPVKQRERGFNQATRLARLLGQALRRPVEERVIQRVQPTPSQTRLNRTQRADNMRRAFARVRGGRPVPRKAVLIDDVFTTGATTSACARVLLEAGAEKVAVWTVARAEFHG